MKKQGGPFFWGWVILAIILLMLRGCYRYQQAHSDTLFPNHSAIFSDIHVAEAMPPGREYNADFVESLNLHRLS